MNRTPLILLLLSLAATMLAFAPMSYELWGAWQTDEYSHGIMLPFLALLLGAHILSAKPVTPHSSWLAAPVYGFAMIGLITGTLAAFHAAAHYGFILALMAISLAFLGRAHTLRLLPAFIYLWFAVPLPHLFQSNLSQELQLLSSTAGVNLLQILGVSVYQEGNIIDLGSFQLQVVDACSGLRYLFPLMSFGFLAAYLLKAKCWLRALLFLSTIPITISMNILRITLIGVTVDLWGPEMARGFIHDFEGWVVFAVCAALLLFEIWIILQLCKDTQFNMDYFSLPPAPVLSSALPTRAPVFAVVTLSIATAVLSASGAISRHITPTASNIPLALFPTELGPWKGKDQALAIGVLQSLQLSDYWLADYKAPNEAGAVNLYIAYYDKQELGSATHSPSNCIPAGGWRITESNVIALPESDGTLQATQLVISKGELNQLVYFWFYERGRTVTQTSYAKWYMLLDAISKGRTDGALIRVTTPVIGDESLEDANKRLQRFILLAQTEITRFIPGAQPNRKALTQIQKDRP